jgi:hypothetical protein
MAMTKAIDPAWKALHDNPPANWRKDWEDKNKVARHDTLEKAQEKVSALKAKGQYIGVDLLIGLHPKDGYVVYYGGVDTQRTTYEYNVFISLNGYEVSTIVEHHKYDEMALFNLALAKLRELNVSVDGGTFGGANNI